MSAGNGGKMSYTSKPFEELDVMDDFLMNAIASNPEVGIPFCRRLLSVALQKKIGKIRVTAQSVIPGLSPKLRGIRLDVEVLEWEKTHSEEQVNVTNVYDIEPHRYIGTDLPRHNRFYQARLDGKYMRSGENNFSMLPNLYVITFTDYDPFGEDYMMYTFSNRCHELPQLEYKDGLQFIYFYTKGRHGGCEAIKNMLTYMCDSKRENVTDEVTKELHSYVERVRVLPEVKQSYMTLEEIIWYRSRDAVVDAKRESVCELLEEYGKIPEDLRLRLNEEKDTDVLARWLKVAAKAESIKDFVEKIDE